MIKSRKYLLHLDNQANGAVLLSSCTGEPLGKSREDGANGKIKGTV